MRRILVIVLAALGLAAAQPARAQVFGQFTGAEALPVNTRMFGGYVHTSENVVGVLAQLRLSFYSGVDFGFQGGFARQDLAGGDVTTLRLGGDLKVTVGQPSADLPITIAVGGNLGVETGDDFNLLTFGPTVTASRTFAVGQGGLTPYGRLGVAIASLDIGDLDDTDISVPLSLGSEFEVAPQMRLVLELQFHLGDSFNDGIVLAGGVNLPF